MVGTGWATSSSDCMDRLRNTTHLAGCWFLARKAARALSRCRIMMTCLLMSLHIISYTWYNEREELGMS